MAEKEGKSTIAKLSTELKSISVDVIYYVCHKYYHGA